MRFYDALSTAKVVYCQIILWKIVMNSDRREKRQSSYYHSIFPDEQQKIANNFIHNNVSEQRFEFGNFIIWNESLCSKYFRSCFETIHPSLHTQVWTARLVSRSRSILLRADFSLLWKHNFRHSRVFHIKAFENSLDLLRNTAWDTEERIQPWSLEMCHVEHQENIYSWSVEECFMWHQGETAAMACWKMLHGAPRRE
jgi:hypothetical protein